MTDDVLYRVSASNPLPNGSTAPALDVVLARIESAPRRPVRRAVRFLVPAISVAIAILVLVVALGSLRTNHKHPAGVPTTRPSIAVVPSGGMRGQVSAYGAGFSSATNGVISLQQCVGCRNGGPTAHSTTHSWLLTTDDGGQTWTLSATHYYVQLPLFAGASGWAGGLQATGPKSGGIARFYVTHDGGRSWSVAPAAAPNEGGSTVSLGGGEVWATGLSTKVAVLHAPVGGSRLNATASQPISGDQTNVRAIAGGSGTAYVFNGADSRQMFVTHDDGRTWQHIHPQCPTADSASLIAAYGDTVWANCSTARGTTTGLARSSDGGQSWKDLPPPSAAVFGLQPVSANVAWLLLPGGKVLRTGDGGLKWHTVWSPASAPHALQSTVPKVQAELSGLPILTAQTPSSASIVTEITRGHVGQQAKFTNLVVYRTTDGGRSWHPYVVSLAMR
jgi:photosystem II stability/assembly factor-like uncharacterized protein